MKKSITVFYFFLIVQMAHAQVPFFKTYQLPTKYQSTVINKLFQDRTGFIWIATNDGILRYDGFEYLHYTTQDSLPDNKVTAIAQDSLGRIWLGHSTGQLSYIQNGHVKQFTTPEGTAVKAISDIYFNAKGVLWFSTLNDGLYYVVRNRLYRLDEMDGLPDLYIYDIAEGNNGSIWIGTDKGIAICSLNSNTVSVATITQKDGLPDNIVKKVIIDNSDFVWLATEDKGVIRY